MKITLLEPFFTGSHRLWAEAWQKYSRHEIEIIALEGRHWKWRMHGGAISLSRLFQQKSAKPDLILATDMLDFNAFLSLSRKVIPPSCPTAIYFHENQLTYPWSPTDPDVKLKRDNHYGFINYSSALAADLVLFNSKYHKDSFLGALPQFLAQFPDYNELDSISEISCKSKVCHIGMELQHLRKKNIPDKTGPAIILWNHRWEYDKNPGDFFELLFKLQDEHIDFRLIVAGNVYKQKPKIFEKAKDQLQDKILHFGYAKTKAAYFKLLLKADILPVCSNQDFFGGSVVEAIAAGCFPILPERLAYPEHIPQAAWPEHLYNTKEQAYQILKSCVINIVEIRQKKHSHFVSRYDWSNLAPQYDQLLAELVQKKRKT